MDLMSEFADENGIGLFCMSAKNGDQVDTCFRTVVSILSGVRLDSESETQVCVLLLWRFWAESCQRMTSSSLFILALGHSCTNHRIPTARSARAKRRGAAVCQPP